MDSLPAQESLSGELWRKRRYILKAAGVALAFWLVQFAYQYFVLIPGELNGSLLRSFALTGATLIGIALCIGPVAVLKTDWNLIRYRRTFGVSGFVFILLHVLAVMAFFFQFNPSYLFFSLDPFQNFLLFGIAAYVFFFPLFLTSTDWAIKRLTYPTWKAVHRLVYFAFVFSVLHFSRINPALLQNPAGYLLSLVTILAFALELSAFVKKVRSGQAGLGAYAGAAITLFAAILLAFAFFPANAT